jgi:hypothetical protein
MGINELYSIGRVELEDGWELAVDWEDAAPSPRDAEENLGHMLAWGRRFESPDENDCDSPEEFMADMLCERFTAEELEMYIRAHALESLEYRQVEGEERLCAYVRNPWAPSNVGWAAVDGADWWSGDVYDLATEIAQHRDASNILTMKVWMKPVFRLEHSGVAYSTGDFGDPWDSGQVGWIFCDRDDALRFYGGEEWLPKGDLSDHVLARLDYEVEHYSQWANGEVFSLTLENADTGDSFGIHNVYWEDRNLAESDLMREAGLAA